MWITNSVFQGAGTKSRAIDVSAGPGGSPKLYIEGNFPLTPNSTPTQRSPLIARGLSHHVEFNSSSNAVTHWTPNGLIVVLICSGSVGSSEAL